MATVEGLSGATADHAVNNEIANLGAIATWTQNSTPDDDSFVLMGPSPDFPRFLYGGVGFAGYLNGRPASGTITGIVDVLANNQATQRWLSVSVPVADYFSYVATNNNAGLAGALFGGADTIAGTAFADRLFGYGGADAITPGGGADVVMAGAGDDTVTIWESSVVLGEVLDGGPGVDTLAVKPESGSFFVVGYDLDRATLTGFERFSFAGSSATIDSEIWFSFAQLGAGLPLNATFVGGSKADYVMIQTPQTGGTFDITNTAFAFESWSATDRVWFGYALGFNGLVRGAPTTNAFSLTGSALGEAIAGSDGLDTLIGLGGADSLFGQAGADILNGGPGDDSLSGGRGLDEGRLSGNRANYTFSITASGWRLADTRVGSPDGADTMTSVERLVFLDQTVTLASLDPIVAAAEAILRLDSLDGTVGTMVLEQSFAVASAAETSAAAIVEIVKAADQTTAVATMSYQFFTNRTPSAGGLDYLVSPTGPNPNNINSPYYQSFNIENRYINFAVNLGKVGEGAPSFLAEYGGKTLFQATQSAYIEIFGGTVTDGKINTILDSNVGSMSRAQYFALYGGDGLTGIGTKAAMVGWLLTEAAKADLGMYARADNDYLADLADGSGPYLIDLIGQYGRAEYIFNG